MTDSWPTELTPTHVQYLSARGVSPEVARARGYRSVTAKNGSGANNLSAYGWGAHHDLKSTITATAAVLVIPMYHCDRHAPSVHQARPDEPRIRDGKALRFELPFGVRRGTGDGDIPADVNPLAHATAQSKSSEVALLVTEGVIKADAVLSAARAEGVPVIPVGLTGVTMGYEAESTDEGVIVRSVAENLAPLVEGARTIYLCWDADWSTNEKVRNSLARTAALLVDDDGDREVVFLAVPEVAGDPKTGVDDWLAAGGTLAELLADHRVGTPEVTNSGLSGDNDEAGGGSSADGEVVPVACFTDRKRRVMWSYETRRKRGASSPTTVAEVKMAALAEITQVISEATITDHELVRDQDIYVVALEWFDTRGTLRRASLEVPSARFAALNEWMSDDGFVGLIERDPKAVAELTNTIRATSTPTAVTAATATGWYRHDGHWRWVCGSGWIGAGVVGDDLAATATASAARFIDPLRSVVDDLCVPATESEPHLRRIDPGRAAEALVAFCSGWGAGGVAQAVIDSGRVDGGEFDTDLVKTMSAEDSARILDTPARRADAAVERSHLDELAERIVIGTMALVRALVPGHPAKGPLYFVGPSGSGKTMCARVITSAMGSAFAERPYVDLSSTPSGVEVQIAPAGDVLLVVDDFRAGSDKEVEKMGRIVDALARASYDGASRARSTRDLRSVKVPPLRASVLLTGEEVPSQSTASNSTVQRMLFLPFRSGTSSARSPRFGAMRAILDDPTPAQAGMTVVISAIATMLDEIESSGRLRRGQSAGDVLMTEARERWAALEFHLERDLLGLAPDSYPNDRTQEVGKDILVGGALLQMCAETAEVFPVRSPRSNGAVPRFAPADHAELYGTVVDAQLDATVAILAATAKRVRATSPGATILDTLRQALLAGTCNVTDRDGSCPSGPTALGWGYGRRADGTWEARGLRVGRVQPATAPGGGGYEVALSPATVAKVVNQMVGGGALNASRVAEMFALARNPAGDGGVVLDRPGVKVTEVLHIDPALIGVSVEALPRLSSDAVPPEGTYPPPGEP